MIMFFDSSDLDNAVITAMIDNVIGALVLPHICPSLLWAALIALSGSALFLIAIFLIKQAGTHAYISDLLSFGIALTATLLILQPLFQIPALSLLLLQATGFGVIASILLTIKILDDLLHLNSVTTTETQIKKPA